jgi:hypothetical protein
MEVSGHLHASAALPPGKEPRLPIGYEAVCLTAPILTHILKKLNDIQPSTEKSVLKRRRRVRKTACAAYIER